jgi:Dr1-associated corepressor
MDDQGGYAPRSPDLSAYHGGPAPPPLQSPSQQQYQPPSFSTYQPPPSATQYNPPSATAYQAPPPYFAPPSQAYPMPGMQQAAGAMSYGPGPSGAPNAEMQDAPETPVAGSAAGPGKGRGRRSKKPKPDEPSDEGLPPAPGVAEGIEVKTKFPVARIKRIMQADEDVGKVAQVTPTAVCEY